MRFLWSLLRWTFLFAVLTALGAVTFHVVRYQPRWTLHTSGIDAVHLSADGRHVFQCVLPGSVSVWDTHSGKLVHELFAEHGVRHLQLSPTEPKIAAILGDNSLWLADWIDGSTWPLDAPKDAMEMHFSDSGRLLLVTAHQSPVTYVYDTATKKCKAVAPGLCKHLSGDDRRLFLRRFGADTLSVIDIETAQTVAELPLTTQDVTFAPTGKRLVAGLHDPHVGPLDDVLKPGMRLSVFEFPTRRVKETPLNLKQDPRRPGVMTPDGDILITWLTDIDFITNLDFVDAASGRVIASHVVERASGGLSPDGSLFAFVGAEAGTDLLMMFEASTGRLLWKRTGVSGSVFLPNAILGHQPSGFTLLDSQTGTEINRSLGDVHPRGDILSSRPGKRLGTLTPSGHRFILRGVQSRNRAPFFWERWLEQWVPRWFGDGRQVDIVVETATGRDLFRLVEHGKRGIVVSDDGSTIFTADGEPETDYVLRVWDVHSQRAYTWAIGVAAGAWLAGRMLKRLWTKVRSRWTACATGIRTSAEHGL